jgi:hypothetical protein
MNNILTFNSTHIDTLSELNSIAKKHNCTIRLYVGDNNSIEAEDIIDVFKEQYELSNPAAEELVSNFEIQNPQSYLASICFELAEQTENGTMYHQLSYIEGYVCCELYESYGRFIDDISDELQSWFDNYWEDPDGGFIHKSFSYTKVKGFNGATADVYREGMALKFFGDLVCDYLDEPRIVKVY